MVRVLAILALLAAPIPASAKMADVDTLVRAFEAVAFSDEFPGKTRWHHLLRWERPIRIKIMEGETPERKADLDRTFDELRRLTDVKIGYSGFWGEENYRVYFVESARDVQRVASQYEISVPSATCLAIIFRDERTKSIKGSVVIMPAHDDGWFRGCISEETAQSLGLRNDTDILVPSLFSDKDIEVTTMTKNDKLLLRALYDPRLKSGMTKDEARPIVRRIFEELTAE